MLPAASASVALQVGERLRKGIENKIVEYNGVRIPLTASLGIAHRPGKEHFPANELIVQADEALYQAKKSGKNRVCFYSSSPVIIGKSAEAGKRVKG
jgi:diguanylate cyclase (GGDEF)-like protein